MFSGDGHGAAKGACRGASETAKIWAHSGDSHFLEPEDLWHQILPTAQAERMPRTELIAEDEEIVHVDGKSFTRTLPRIMTRKGADGLTIAEAQLPPARVARRRVPGCATSTRRASGARSCTRRSGCGRA